MSRTQPRKKLDGLACPTNTPGSALRIIYLKRRKGREMGGLGELEIKVKRRCGASASIILPNSAAIKRMQSNCYSPQPLSTS